MSVFYCELCGALRDGDFVGCNEWADGLVCDDCFTENTPEDFEDWIVSYWKKPIPIRTLDWEIVHKDYDPTPLDSGGPPGDDRFFQGPTLADVWQQVIEYNEAQDA